MAKSVLGALSKADPAVSPACDKWIRWNIYRKKRANNAYHLLLSSFSSFIGSVVCHTLPLCGKSPFSIISFDFPSLPLCLTFFSGLVCFYADPLHNQPSWNQPCHAHRCSRELADMVLTLLRSIIKHEGSAHRYLYIHIHTNASSESDCCHQD